MQEILVSRGKSLELLRPDPNTGKVHTLLTVEVFGIVRSLMAFRLTGGTKGKDHVSEVFTYSSVAPTCIAVKLPFEVSFRNSSSECIKLNLKLPLCLINL
jgi:hypothetical protein